MMQFLRISIIAASVFCSLAVPINDELLNGKYEYEFVDIDHNVAQSYSAESSLNVKTKAFGQDFDLRLRKLPSIFSKNFHFLWLELDEKKQPSLREEKLKNDDAPIYQDVDHKSILHVEYHQNGEIQLEGSLTPELSIVHSSQLKVKNPTGSHVVVKTNFKKTFVDKMMSFKPTPRLPRGYSRADAVIPDLVRPELMAVMDYDNTAKLDFDTPKIQRYIAIFWNAVNTRYELISNPEYQIMVVGIVATKSKELQPYIELSRSKVDHTIDLAKTLPYLNMFLYNNLNNLAEFDIAMLMTAEDMAGEDETGAANPNVAGVAYVAGACAWDPNSKMILSAGMAEDHVPFYDGVLNHAHEVAHLLGAAHDGDPPVDFLPGHPGAEDCPWSDGYLMSYIFGTKNHLRFSDCTVKQLRYLLHEQNGGCLLTLQNKKYVPLNKTLPGQIVSLDSQCQTYLGSEGMYFRGQNMDKICTILYCYLAHETTASSRGPALEGSPCGDVSGKWCRDGECVRKQ